MLTVVVAQFIFKNLTISDSTGDNCFITKDNEVIVIESLNKVSSQSLPTLNCIVLQKRSLSIYPCESRLLGIYEIDSFNSGILTTFKLSDLLFKCVLLPFQDRFVSIPFTKSI